MRKIFLTLLLLIAAFFLVWNYKIRHPINPIENATETAGTPWYNQQYTSPVADDEWVVDPEIPLNYVPVPGEDEMYMVVDDSGKIINYRQRTKASDGSWEWTDITSPDISKKYESVDGLTDVYKVTDEEGIVSYQRYVRNDDNSYAFVEVDENGTPTDDGSDAKTITDNFQRVVDNVYAKYNENGVLVGYRERVDNGDNTYSWKVVDAPTAQGYVIQQGTKKQSTDSSSNTNEQSSQNADGTYTVTDTSTDTVTEDGYNVTYKTTVILTYSADGTLIKTQKDGPYVVSKVAIGGSTNTPNQSLIADTLDGELARVSQSVTFNTSKASEVLAKLNAQRVSQGLSELTMNTSSEAYKLACIKAADMAIYNHGSSSSPMYGTLEELISRYGCTTSNPSENIWKTSEVSASEIHTRFQANENARLVRMSDYTNVGIAIVDKDGQSYIAEVYLN